MRDDAGSLPFISICMPVYNAAWSINRVLDSILNIDYPRESIRLVFVDANSQDSTWDLLTRFKDLHQNQYESIRLVNTSPRGIGRQRNEALKHAKGWVFSMDSDMILPPEILRHLLEHFRRDPKVGLARCAWSREDPTLIERVAMSRNPRTWRYVEVTECNTTLFRPEALQHFGCFKDEGGRPSDWWEATYQFVRLRKSGWRIVNDGCLADKCIHLARPGKHWGDVKRMDSDAGRLGHLKSKVRSARRVIDYYLRVYPKKPLSEWIQAGDRRSLTRVCYFLGLPYITLASIFLLEPVFAIPFLVTLIVFAVRTRGLAMRVITPLALTFRWVLIAHGYLYGVIKTWLESPSIGSSAS